MSEKVMLIPLSPNVGLTTISLGLVAAIEQLGATTAFFKPISEDLSGAAGQDRSTAIATACDIPTVPPISVSQAEDWIGQDQYDELLEKVVANFSPIEQCAQLVVVEGLAVRKEIPYANRLNMDVARTLGVRVVFVAAPGESGVKTVTDLLEVAHHYYGSGDKRKIAGCIVNGIEAPGEEQHGPSAVSTDAPAMAALSRTAIEEAFAKGSTRLLGAIPWRAELTAPRVSDLAIHLSATVVNAGNMQQRRVHSLVLRSSGLAHTLFRAGQVIITPGDRADILVGAALACMNGVEVAAVVLNGGLSPAPTVLELCSDAMARGLPILQTDADTWQTTQQLQEFNVKLPVDDFERLRQSREHVAEHLDSQWLESLIGEAPGDRHFSPPAFRYLLTERARATHRRIVLPEGDEPRTVRAAVICSERQIADCILLGDREDIEKVALQQGVELPAGLEIISPADIRERYVEALVDLRKHKGVTALSAEEQLQDNVVLGTMMLAMGQVDGLVSGAVHTTANTIRPALQLIKTAPGVSLVSSVFFMLLPEQVLVYGDCAINPDPTADQLADIAIQSAASAAAFGITPRVAMVSYSTGASGSGSEVEKVRSATALVKQRRPDIVVDGPLQYDAAVMENVARTKAPDSPVAGRATVLVFPDLNTGNTTYKAVQRSAKLVSIGPMLQGLAKPVNDLSRGALVDDIVYTIALTAIQAGQAESSS